MKKNDAIKRLVLAALFLALGLVLPFLTGQIPEIGTLLLPMHLPVLVCGLICGWKYGMSVGFLLPILRGVLFGMPRLYPAGISMAFEMAVYGAVIGLLYMRMPKNTRGVYGALIPAMLAGRIVWGAVRALCSGVGGSAFTWQLFLAGAFVEAIPGIILQLVFIPALMAALQKTGVLNDGRDRYPNASGAGGF